MGETTKIEWTDHTFNPWWGCQRVSPGCEHCYAETFSKRVGLKVWGPHTERRFFGEKHWREPIKWNAAAEKAGARARVFCASMADVFEDREDLVAPRARLWRMIDETPWLDWLLLTKRPQNAATLAQQAAILAWDGGGPDRPTWLPNIWLGTTAEDQKRADERIPELLKVPAAVRFVSYEPALGPVNFYGAPAPDDTGPFGVAWKQTSVVLRTDYGDERDVAIEPGVDWIIVGGESGPGARPFDLAWARSVVAQCKVAGVACFVKQVGSNPHGEWGDTNTPKAHVTCSTGESWIEENRFKNGRWRLNDRKGGSSSEWPQDLRVREWPSTPTARPERKVTVA